jgi:hypothetical protein
MTKAGRAGRMTRTRSSFRCISSLFHLFSISLTPFFPTTVSLLPSDSIPTASPFSLPSRTISFSLFSVSIVVKVERCNRSRCSRFRFNTR